MGSNTDYAQMSLEELRGAEKKARREQVASAVLIGVLTGVLIYGLATKGFGFLHIALPVGLIILLTGNATKTKERLAAIRSELGKKQAG